MCCIQLLVDKEDADSCKHEQICLAQCEQLSANVLSLMKCILCLPVHMHSQKLQYLKVGILHIALMAMLPEAIWSLFCTP